MTNLEKYNEAFISSFNVEETALASLVYQGVKEWDSIGHMSLV